MNNSNNINKYLEFENFCYVYGNLDEYTVVDGGKKGGYLIQAIRNIFAQINKNNDDLMKIIGKIRIEALRLVKGESNKKNAKFVKSNNPARQIVECTNNIQHEVYFDVNKT